MIEKFEKPYKEYSNFYPCIIVYYRDGLTYPSVEHAFVAQKTTEYFFKRLIAALDADAAGLARARGRMIKLRPNWDLMKLRVMRELVTIKFSQPQFEKVLLSSNNEELVECNYHHDNFWGNCLCEKCKNIPGLNHLGKILMNIREDKQNGRETGVL